jgi:hypothetical protein
MNKLRATFGDNLIQAHRTLLADLRKVRDAVRKTPADRPEDLAAVLEATRGDLGEHFRFEEENGYMAGVLQVQPHLARAVGHLQEEHGRLLQGLDDLIAQTRQSAGLADELRQQVIAWLGEVRRHERSENVLVQDAFNLDLTAED